MTISPIGDGDARRPSFRDRPTRIRQFTLSLVGWDVTHPDHCALEFYGLVSYILVPVKRWSPSPPAPLFFGIPALCARCGKKKAE